MKKTRPIVPSKQTRRKSEERDNEKRWPELGNRAGGKMEVKGDGEVRERSMEPTAPGRKGVEGGEEKGANKGRCQE